MKTLAPFYRCPLPFPSKVWRAQVINVKDGDTIDVIVDKGWDHFQADMCEIRFASIDTWESKGAWPKEHIALGKKAWDLNKALCAGRWVYLLTAMDPEEYGRILGDPFSLGDDGAISDVSYELWKSGAEKVGTKYPYRGPTGGPRDIRKYLAEFGAGR